MLGVVRAPSLFSMTRTSLPSMMATQEFVVPEVDADDFAHSYVSFAADGARPEAPRASLW